MVLPLLGAAAVVGGTVVSLVFNRERRIRQVLAHPFPEEWERILDRNVPIYRRMPEDLRQKLRDDVQVICAWKNFEGCGGLEISDEIRVTIAGQAAILTLNARPELKYFPKLVTILVYPSSYVTKDGHHRLGESWDTGSVVLSWDNARHGAKDFHDGDNVVLHEFAHQLDHHSGSTDGAPPLETREQYGAWARVLGKAYEHLIRDIDHHRRTVLDPYGATNPAEFFAVATETFFEKSKKLREKRPELYAVLKDYYKLDPAEWHHAKKPKAGKEKPAKSS